MTTIHAHTARQAVVDGAADALRMGAAAAANIVPATTVAASPVGQRRSEINGVLTDESRSGRYRGCYDNAWGYSNQMVREASRIAGVAP